MDQTVCMEEIMIATNVADSMCIDTCFLFQGVQLYLLKFALLALREALQMNPITTAAV